MAISGRFEADFVSFYEACRLAQVSLKGFESSTRDVEKQVNEMVDSFSGRRVVSEATVMADAVGKIGGPARLTQQELRRVGQVADEAIEKMNRWGETPPRNLLRLADASRAARSGLSEAAGQIREVDNVLDVFGIHLGPARKAIDDLGYAAENGAGKLGLIGSAGLTLGAAIGGWQLGRAISEFTGLDEKIGDVVLHLQGLPTVAEQAAAATADAIARAQKAHPELTVLTGETARLLNELDAKSQVAANAQASDIADRVEAVARVAAEIKKVMDEVDTVRKSGIWDDLSKQINSHAVSMQELAKQYHISDEALNILAKDAQHATEIESNNAKKLADLRDELQKAEIKRQKDKIDADKKAQDELFASIDAQTKANEAQHEKDIALAESQALALRRTKEETRALEEQAEAAKKAKDAAQVFTQDYDLSTADARARFLRNNPNATISGAANDAYFKTHSLADAVRDGLVAFYGGAPGYGGGIGSGTPPPPVSSPQAPRGGSSAAATSPQGAGQGFGQPAGGGFQAPAPGLPLPALPSAGSVAGGRLPFGPGGFTQIYAPVLVSGVFDPSSSHALGATVSRALFQSVANARVVR